MSIPPATSNAPNFEWSTIDTVLLDMDGTLLDLRFDNYFWQQLVPEKFAERRGLSLEDARTELEPRFRAEHGRLAWYCIDFWSRELELPIAELKFAAREHIGWLQGAQLFLQRVRAQGKRMLLVTNAHAETLRIKNEQTGLGGYFDALVSSHSTGYPKEHPNFWSALEAQHPFDLKRTLFVDDSLPVLRAARTHGIAHIVRITHPDSSLEPNTCDEFAAVHRIESLIPSKRDSEVARWRDSQS